jgi:hypothetical protein
MMKKMRTLSVVANPYVALDEHGTPSCAVLVEGVSDQYVGATIDVEAEKAAGGKRRLRFSTMPVTVPLSAYYIRRMRDRELLPADADSARWAGQHEFELPEQILARERKQLASTDDT